MKTVKIKFDGGDWVMIRKDIIISYAAPTITDYAVKVYGKFVGVGQIRILKNKWIKQ